MYTASARNAYPISCRPSASRCSGAPVEYGWRWRVASGGRVRSLTLNPGSWFTVLLMDGLRISELAGRAGVATSTVRYYERVGLMPGPERTASGYRSYGRDAETRL